MKKSLLFLIGAVLAIGQCVPMQAQIDDPGRVYDTVTDVDTFYLFSKPKPCLEEGEYIWSWTPLNTMLQEYATTDTVTVYGVAITFRNRYGLLPENDTNFIAWLFRRTGINTELSFASQTFYYFQPIDSVSCFRSHPRFCWFLYEDTCIQEKNDYLAPCYEFYFDTPKQINRMTDTFYVGRLASTYTTYFDVVDYGARYDNSLPAHVYINGGMDQFEYNRFVLQTYYRHKRWGWAFPIIGFRCGPIMHYQLDSYTGDSAVVSWHSVEEGTIYNIRLVGEDGSDTTFITEDTTFTFTQLSDSVRYNVMLRKQCHYATSNYDTTVYGQWRSTLYFGNDTTDTTSRIIGRSEEGGIAVVPNPAKEEVTVSAGVGLQSIEAYNESGTCVYSGKCSGMTATLDVAAWPQGLYVLNIATAAGTTVKKLVVTR